MKLLYSLINCFCFVIEAVGPMFVVFTSDQLKASISVPTESITVTVNQLLALLVPLTQLLVLVVRQDEDDVRPDVAAVSLEAGLQTLARGYVGVAERHREEQEEEESPRHGLRPLTSPKGRPISCFPPRRLDL